MAIERGELSKAGEIRYATGGSSLGILLVATSRRGICAILFGDSPADVVRELEASFPRARLIAAQDDLRVLLASVETLVDSPQTSFELPLDMQGSTFRRRVWEALRQIPPGSTVSYAEIAGRIAAPAAVRAVAGACAANTLALAVPCHRVVRSDGGLSGYRWGVERKRALLAREAATASS